MRQFVLFDPDAYRRRLRALRKYFGESQAEFTQRLGMPTKKWSHYECGYPIPRETAFLLKQKVGVSVEWLWYGEEGNMPTDMLQRLRQLEREEIKLGGIIPPTPRKTRRRRRPAAAGAAPRGKREPVL